MISDNREGTESEEWRSTFEGRQKNPWEKRLTYLL